MRTSLVARCLIDISLLNAIEFKTALPLKSASFTSSVLLCWINLRRSRSQSTWTKWKLTHWKICNNRSDVGTKNREFDPVTYVSKVVGEKYLTCFYDTLVKLKKVRRSLIWGIQQGPVFQFKYHGTSHAACNHKIMWNYNVPLIWNFLLDIFWRISRPRYVMVEQKFQTTVLLQNSGK